MNDPFAINPFASSQQSIQDDPFSSNPFLSEDVQKAKNDIGDQNFNNLCEKFVEQNAFGKTGIYKSAAQAWNDYVSKGKAYSGTQGMQPGDIIYFAPDEGNSNFGHAGIATGPDSMVSATYAGVREDNLQKWQQQTGQQILGYVRP